MAKADAAKHRMMHIRVREITYGKVSADALKKKATQQKVVNELIETHYFGDTIDNLIEQKLKTIK